MTVNECVDFLINAYHKATANFMQMIDSIFWCSNPAVGQISCSTFEMLQILKIYDILSTK